MEKNHPKKQIKMKKAWKRNRQNIWQELSQSFAMEYWKTSIKVAQQHILQRHRISTYLPIPMSVKMSNFPNCESEEKTFQTALNFDEPQFIQESVFCSNCFLHFCSFHHKAAANLCIADFGNLFYEQRNFVSIVDFLTCHFQEGWTLKVF